jgi:penicillin-binding protein 1A
MATAYSEIVNGGRKIGPSFIDRVQDRTGKTIFRTDDRPCDGCQAEWQDGMTPPIVPDEREQVTDPQTAYQMVHMLEGVVQWGTGTAVRAVGKPLAGKTGTSNDSKDVWFMGFSPDLTVGVFFGFDQPRSLGGRETGGVVAAPVFRDFMTAALAEKPAVPFRVPSGIRLVRVDARTGLRASAGTEKVIYEAFKPGTEPTGRAQPVIEGIGVAPETSFDGTTGTGTTTAPQVPSLGGSDGGTGGLY